jgi:hypothetical protein
VSRIIRGQFWGVSEVKLLELVAKLGHDVKIVVGPVRRRAGKSSFSSRDHGGQCGVASSSRRSKRSDEPDSSRDLQARVRDATNAVLLRKTATHDVRTEREVVAVEADLRGAMWIVFGNPTQNTGRFAQCFGKFKHRWITRQIDSRTAKMANKVQIQKWIDDYGEDHDFVRVRVRGVFPRAGDVHFIGLDIVGNAVRFRHEPATRLSPLS